MSKRETRKSQYRKTRAYWARVHKRDAEKGEDAPKRHTKKYIQRPSPAFPANKFCGRRKKGNDGNWWISKPSISGVCRWVRI